MSDLHGGSAGPGTDGGLGSRRGRRVRPGAVPDARPGWETGPATAAVPTASTGPFGSSGPTGPDQPSEPSQPFQPTQPSPEPSFDDLLSPGTSGYDRGQVFDVDAERPASVLPVRPEDAEPYADEAAVEQDLVDDPYVEDHTDEPYAEEYVDESYVEDGVDEPYAAEAYGEHEVVEEHLVADDDHDDYRDARRPRRRGRTVAVLVVCLALLGGAVYAGWSFLSPIIDRVTADEAPAEDFPGPGSGEVDVVVEPGDTGGAIGSTLLEAGVVASRAAFVAEFTATPEAASLQPGTYRLRKEMKASEALALLLDPAARQSVQVGVREGLWVSEMLPEISAATGFTVEELQAALVDPAVGLPPEAEGNPEGYLFPATYSFEPGTTPVEIFTAMVARHNQAMDDLGVPAEQRRDVLVRAAIVQGEASREEDMAKVARVIANRLERGETLGMDSTVGYIVQKRALDLTQSDLETDSPYNTRINTGLPPGPINNPGEAAIAAALAPAEGDWLYFVTVDGDTGETIFTSDYDEFLAAKQQFQEWLAQNG